MTERSSAYIEAVEHLKKINNREYLKDMTIEKLRESLEIVRKRYRSLTKSLIDVTKQSDEAWELQYEIERLAKEISSRENQPKPINYYAIAMNQAMIEWEGGIVPEKERITLLPKDFA